MVKGTRVTVRTLLGNLAEGASEQDVRTDFPTVTAGQSTSRSRATICPLDETEATADWRTRIIQVAEKHAPRHCVNNRRLTAKRFIREVDVEAA